MPRKPKKNAKGKDEPDDTARQDAIVDEYVGEDEARKDTDVLQTEDGADSAATEV